MDGSDDELSCYGEELKTDCLESNAKRHQRKVSEIITINVDRKSSTGSQVSNADSLDDADEFVPVDIDVGTVKQVLNMYQKHSRKVSSGGNLPVTKE